MACAIAAPPPAVTAQVLKTTVVGEARGLRLARITSDS
jgi:hypothetical protein